MRGFSSVKVGKVFDLKKEGEADSIEQSVKSVLCFFEGKKVRLKLEIQEVKPELDLGEGMKKPAGKSPKLKEG